MEQDHIPLTALDQMVGGNQEQLLKALIPYLPPGPQQFLSLFAKAKEFSNTIALFGYGHPTPMQAASVSSQPLRYPSGCPPVLLWKLSEVPGSGDQYGCDAGNGEGYEQLSFDR